MFGPGLKVTVYLPTICALLQSLNKVNFVPDQDYPEVMTEGPGFMPPDDPAMYDNPDNSDVIDNSVDVIDKNHYEGPDHLKLIIGRLLTKAKQRLEARAQMNQVALKMIQGMLMDMLEEPEPRT